MPRRGTKTWTLRQAEADRQESIDSQLRLFTVAAELGIAARGFSAHLSRISVSVENPPRIVRGESQIS